MRAADFFSTEDRERIVQAIHDAELDTSGEIRVHVELSFRGDLLDRAASVFARLKMHKTKLRNGVLFYLAVKNRKFAVIGDAGINRVVPANFWDDVKQAMEEHFKNSEFATGLEKGIRMAGEHLKKKFPHQPDDVDELPDDISFGKNG
jgi:uncharacterized membrane protein